MQNTEGKENSLKGSKQIEKDEEQVYEQNQSEKQELYYCSDEQNEDQLCQKLSPKDSLSQKKYSISRQSPPSLQNRPPRSIFHNFQKHLVITLRQIIKMKKSSHKNQPQDLAYDLWSNFAQQTKIYTKNILQFVFGVVDFESGNLINVYDEQIVKKFGFGEIFAKHSDQMICQAQDLIRKEVIRQMREVDLQSLLKTRRIGTTDKFEQYMREFINELEEGPMRKRLPKVKKVEMGFIKNSANQVVEK